jgi:hypothetical protein
MRDCPTAAAKSFASGDIVIVPHGDAHFIDNGSPEKPVDSFRIFAKHLSEGLKAVRFGGGEITRFICVHGLRAAAQ